MNWKDYFYFNRSERIGITTLIILIGVVIIFPFAYTWIFPPKTYDFSEFKSAATEYAHLYNDYLAARQAIDIQVEQLSNTSRNVVLTPFDFDPNSITQEDLLKLGLPQHIARNIINFRNAGGTFRFREDLKRLYTLDESLYSQLEPYIDLPTRAHRSSAIPESLSRSAKESANQERAIIRPTAIPRELLDINLADTLQWQKIRGIGPVFARRIVAYRNRLGGFYSKNQLLEVFGMDTIRFNQIRPYITLNQSVFTKIDINTADFAALAKHPYINRNIANSIIRIREMHGHFNNTEELKKSHLINDSVFERIAPYITTYIHP